jgi:hypothetical protein
VKLLHFFHHLSFTTSTLGSQHCGCQSRWGAWWETCRQRWSLTLTQQTPLTEQGILIFHCVDDKPLRWRTLCYKLSCWPNFENRFKLTFSFGWSAFTELSLLYVWHFYTYNHRLNQKTSPSPPCLVFNKQVGALTVPLAVIKCSFCSWADHVNHDKIHAVQPDRTPKQRFNNTWTMYSKSAWEWHRKVF